MGLATPVTVRKLQEALHVKAKDSSDFRFYALYDKVYRCDVLSHAYRICRANRGAAGVDGQAFADIEALGREEWLEELAGELRTRTYQPDAVRRVFISKPGQPGKVRPLGIPTIRDRVVMTAAVLVLEPIFEADLQPEQYAYRPGRSALDAVENVRTLLKSGHREVVDADLSGYFDSIPHVPLMKSVARRVCDSAMLHLIKMWLEAPVEETDERGRKQLSHQAKSTGRGIPQGAPISPLLSNLYMRRFILGWRVSGHERRFDAKVVNYADDLVLCCRNNAPAALAAMRTMMGKLQLTVNESKTKVCRLPEESFDFLGYTFGRCYSRRSGMRYIGNRPSKRKVQSICRQISELTQRRWCFLKHEEQVARLNRLMVGWANYFCVGAVRKPYRAVTRHAESRLRRWLQRKHKVKNKGFPQFDHAFIHHELGLVDLLPRIRNLPWAKT